MANKLLKTQISVAFCDTAVSDNCKLFFVPISLQRLHGSFSVLYKLRRLRHVMTMTMSSSGKTSVKFSIDIYWNSTIRHTESVGLHFDRSVLVHHLLVRVVLQANIVVLCIFNAPWLILTMCFDRREAGGMSVKVATSRLIRSAYDRRNMMRSRPCATECNYSIKYSSWPQSNFCVGLDSFGTLCFAAPRLGWRDMATRQSTTPYSCV